MSKSYNITLLCLCILALAGLWGNKHYFKKKPTSSNAPEIIATKIKQFHVDAANNTSIVLQADSMQQFTDTGKTIYKNIHIDAYTNKQLTWTMDATNGHIVGNDNDRIILSGDIHIKRIATAQRAESNITTSALTIDRKTHLVTSDQRVNLVQGNTKISGQGLRADLKTGTIKLLSNVSSHYELTDPQIHP